MIASPIRVNGDRVDGRPAAALGADTNTILAESGIGPAEIEALRADGAI
jgi:crotonobetainyl-CoA:carnitine CoA-transferase CaiB-like acyl-CoA transferase